MVVVPKPFNMGWDNHVQHRNVFVSLAMEYNCYMLLVRIVCAYINTYICIYYVFIDAYNGDIGAGANHFVT